MDKVLLTLQDKDSLKALRQKIIDSENEFLIKAMKNGELEDEYLLRFIRSRGYDLDSSFDRVKRFHETRVFNNPEIFLIFLPSVLERGFRLGGIKLLKQKDRFGRNVIVVKLSLWDTSVITGDDALVIAAMMGWECLRSRETQEKGLINIYDVEGFSLAHAKYFTPSFILKWANVIVKSSPAKIKTLHFVNVHSVFGMTLNLLKMFLPKKIAARIVVHKNHAPDILDEYIPSNHLPVSLGGQLEEEEAFDQEFLDKLFSPEIESYYKKFLQPSLEAIDFRNRR